MSKIKFIQPIQEKHRNILTEELIEFFTNLVETFGPEINNLLINRNKRKLRIKGGELPDFLTSTREIREREWKVAAVKQDLMDRRIEITGPVDRKMIINALNSGANVFMADFEDSTSPTWDNILDGQLNLRDAVNRTISFTNYDGKKYSLVENPAVLMVRPRGLHLKERNVSFIDVAIPGCLIDFGIYFFTNVHELLKRGSGPYFYLPKLENHLEARLWNEIFSYSEDYLELERGTIRATVLIEHILAAFEMDEILYELRDHSAGLNCGRWDYIFSFIKTFSHNPEFVVPDRVQVTMNTHFMKSYVDLLIQTCHKRGIHAMGGMAAQIPIKDNETANAVALEKVRQDKLREVKAGHDGTWIAHPGLLSVAKAAFDEFMPLQNQLDKSRAEITVNKQDLLKVPNGTISESGVRINISVGLRYLTSWLSGIGSVAIDNLMEDAATAEICRTQLWQWIHHKCNLFDGRILDHQLFNQILEEEVAAIRESQAKLFGENFDEAVVLFKQIIFSEELEEFLTIKAYEILW